MTEPIRPIIERLEACIQKAQESGDKYDFIDPAFDLIDELEGSGDSVEAIEPILQLIERSPAIDYGGPGPLGGFLEKYYKKGYEELLQKSIERRPTEYTLHLLHRLINDEENPRRQDYLSLMRRISLSDEYPENIVENAKDSLTCFEQNSSLKTL